MQYEVGKSNTSCFGMKRVLLEGKVTRMFQSEKQVTKGFTTQATSESRYPQMGKTQSGADPT